MLHLYDPERDQIIILINVPEEIPNETIKLLMPYLLQMCALLGFAEPARLVGHIMTETLNPKNRRIIIFIKGNPEESKEPEKTPEPSPKDPFQVKE